MWLFTVLYDDTHTGKKRTICREGGGNIKFHKISHRLCICNGTAFFMYMFYI